MRKIKVGHLEIHVEHKDIANAHLSVHPPEGKIKIAAPLRMSDDAIRLFVVVKLPWIKRQVKAHSQQERETKRLFVSGESHYFFGQRYLLEIVQTDKRSQVVLKAKRIQLHVAARSTRDFRERVMSNWYRKQLKQELPKIIENWQVRLGLDFVDWGVRKMKNQWGSCLTTKNKILLNSELAKQPYQSLDYIVLHELTHLIEPYHSEKFFKILDKKLPQWRAHREELNKRLPFFEY